MTTEQRAPARARGYLLTSTATDLHIYRSHHERSVAAQQQQQLASPFHSLMAPYTTFTSVHAPPTSTPDIASHSAITRSLHCKKISAYRRIFRGEFSAF